MNKEYIPYVYFVKNKTTGLKYLGVRYAKGCNPSDFWVDYFTSSSSIEKLLKEFGKEDFLFRILHKFPNDPKSAILKEAEYFKLLKEKTDYLNMCYSSGLQDLRINSKSGKVGGYIVFNKKIGIFRDEEERKKWASMGGKVGGCVQRDNNLGIHIHETNPELFKEWCSQGGKNGCFSISSIMKKHNCGEEEATDILKQQQSERGKIGGKKNKGSKWYNDGVQDFKYSVDDQRYLSFEEFLIKNKQFKSGRIR
jgi:hypothetical protein